MAHIGFKKWTGGSAGALHDYLKEEDPELEKTQKDDQTEAFMRYHDAKEGALVFDHVRSNDPDFLPGLELTLGLTKAQFEDVFNGRWGDEVLTEGGHRKVWEKDAKGREIWIDDPSNPGKQTRIPVMEQELTRAGKPRFDVEGNPIMKQKMEYARIPGYDFPIALSKDRAEFLIAHPEFAPVYAEIMKQASDLFCQLVQRHVPLVKVQGKLVHADAILWTSVAQFAARPTTASDQRLDGEGIVDPHLHCHTFVFAAAKHGDRFRQLDGIEITRNMEWLTAAVENFVVQMETEKGIQIGIKDPTRTGRRDSEIVGSNPDIRKLFSTNSEREWVERMAFERKYGRPWTDAEKERQMTKTKGAKTQAAKEADAGRGPFWDKLRQVVADEGLEMTIAAPGLPRGPGPRPERVESLHGRLETQEGLVRDCDETSVFGPEAVIPAVFRMSAGLGFSAQELEHLAQDYLDNHLVLVREAADPSARLYTTKTVLAAEKANREWIERKKSEWSDTVPEEIVERVSAKYNLDPGQDKALRAACLTSSRIVVIRGKAGAGKGRTAEAIAEAFREAGIVNDIAAMADAAKRGNSFGDQVNADHKGSIESVKRVVQARKWRPSSRDLVFVDEAGQVNTFRMQDIAASVGGAKVILFGDEKQLPAIGPAGWLEEQLDNNLDGIPNAELDTVYRHTDRADMEAFDLIRYGHAHAALSDMADRGRLHVAEDAQHLVALTMERVRLHRDSGRTADEVCVVSQGSNTNLDTINRFVQRDRIARGELDPSAHVKVEEWSTGRRWSLMTGDLVVFNKPYYDGKREPIRNGTTGKVLRVEGRSVRVELDTKDRRTLTIDLPEGTDVQPVAPRYAMSTAKFQGDSVKVNIVLPGNPGIASLNSGYSQVTRAVDHVDVVFDRETWGHNAVRTLGRAWSQSALKISALTEMEREVEAQVEKLEWDLEWELEDVDGLVYARRRDPEIPQPEPVVTAAPAARSLIDELRAELRQVQREEQSLDRGIGLGL